MLSPRNKERIQATRLVCFVSLGVCTRSFQTRMKTVATALLSTLLLLSSPSWSENKYVIGMGAGWQNYSSAREFRNDDILGIHFGYRLNQRWGINSLYTTSDTVDAPNLDIQTTRVHVAGLYHLRPYRLIQPYFGSGLGQTIFKSEQNTDSQTVVNVSAGLYVAPTGWAWPIRIAYNSFYSTENDLIDNTFMISFSHFFGPELKSKSVTPPPAPELSALPTEVSVEVHPLAQSLPPEGFIASEKSATDSVLLATPSASTDASGFTVQLSEDCIPPSCTAPGIQNQAGSVEEQSMAIPSIDIRFSVDSTEVLRQSKEAIETLAKYLKQNPHQQIIFAGHSDAQGSRAYNKSLSINRAIRIRDILVYQYSLDRLRIKVLGFGEDRPVADNSSESGRAENRRVEIQLPASVAGTREPF